MSAHGQTGWERAPEHDKRIARGDDHAGDAWRHTGTGDIRWTAVGHSIEPLPRFEAGG